LQRKRQRKQKEKEIRMGIEKKIEMLSKWELELILLKLIDTDKEINVGNKTRNEINKAYEKEIHEVV
jgi:hypothetical protein